MIRHEASTVRRSAHRKRPPMTSSTASATVQRQNERATGGTVPTTARPITTFPDQNNVVSTSNR